MKDKTSNIENTKILIEIPARLMKRRP